MKKMLISIKKDKLNLTFNKKSDFNKFALLKLIKEDNKEAYNSKKILERSSLFDLLENLGYEETCQLIETQNLPIDKQVLWSDEKSKEIKLFRFNNEVKKGYEQWYIINEKNTYQGNAFFEKFEQGLNHYGFHIMVTH